MNDLANNDGEQNHPSTTGRDSVGYEEQQTPLQNEPQVPVESNLSESLSLTNQKEENLDVCCQKLVQDNKTVIHCKNHALIESILEQMTCAICWDIFCIPRVLICGHTFCAHCLAKFQDANTICCPICRCVTQLSFGGVKTLNQNFQVRAIAELLEKAGLVVRSSNSFNNYYHHDGTVTQSPGNTLACYLKVIACGFLFGILALVIFWSTYFWLYPPSRGRPQFTRSKIPEAEKGAQRLQRINDENKNQRKEPDIVGRSIFPQSINPFYHQFIKKVNPMYNYHEYLTSSLRNTIQQALKENFPSEEVKKLLKPLCNTIIFSNNPLCNE